MKTQSLHNQLVEWRHDLHMHPQLSFEEEYAAAKVSTLLKEFGIEVHSGIARTGVVGILPILVLRLTCLPDNPKRIMKHRAL